MPWTHWGLIDAIGTDPLTTITVERNEAAAAQPGAAGVAAHALP